VASLSHSHSPDHEQHALLLLFAASAVAADRRSGRLVVVWNCGAVVEEKEKSEKRKSTKKTKSLWATNNSHPAKQKTRPRALFVCQVHRI